MAAGEATGHASQTTPIPLWFEIGSFVVLIAVLLFDLLYVVKRPHIPSMKEASLWVAFYVSLALIFFGLMWVFVSDVDALQFLTGWVTEYSLSVDNLFVFIIIMANFAVPRKYQQEVLMVGIIIALVLRGIFILVGAAIIENFAWVFYIFGAFLLFTAYKQIREATSGEDEEEDEPGLVKKLTARMNVAPHFDGNKLRTTINGKRMWTPMIAVFIALGMTDLMFAIDSIPAIFGITQSPFIVFTANIFALMGLRQLYFLLGGLMDRLVYLKHGIAVILAFIGVKLVLHALEKNDLPFINGGQPVPVPHIDTNLSLFVIVGTLVVAIVASLLSPAGKAAAAEHKAKQAEEEATQQSLLRAEMDSVADESGHDDPEPRTSSGH
ncbi:TerC family protein [Galactobacter valiniphilus]|uniref:TerC family protein n=1 Tax=Galactobacter valiniphilus TaxID=2676122 RepID=A0A399J941_9MICC|nr:TerC family protein [Galactobacter valiniphilus]RII41744.1 TerC family protein [Galactobacter valiniphilus]